MGDSVSEPVKQVYFHEHYAMNDIGNYTESFGRKLRKLSNFKPISQITKRSLVKDVWPMLDKKGFVHKLYLGKGPQTNEFVDGVDGEEWNFVGPWTAVYVTGSAHVVLAFSKPADAVLVKLKLL